jgi:hypothetical protein
MRRVYGDEKLLLLPVLDGAIKIVGPYTSAFRRANLQYDQKNIIQGPAVSAGPRYIETEVIPEEKVLEQIEFIERQLPEYTRKAGAAVNRFVMNPQYLVVPAAGRHREDVQREGIVIPHAPKDIIIPYEQTTATDATIAFLLDDDATAGHSAVGAALWALENAEIFGVKRVGLVVDVDRLGVANFSRVAEYSEFRGMEKEIKRHAPTQYEEGLPFSLLDEPYYMDYFSFPSYLVFVRKTESTSIQMERLRSGEESLFVDSLVGDAPYEGMAVSLKRPQGVYGMDIKKARIQKRK